MKVFCDGGSRGNPGPAASAFVAYDEDGNVVHSEGKHIGQSTNNVAEYTALIMALSWLSENSIESAEIIMDSELVVRQMTGVYKIKSENTKVLSARAKELERKIKEVRYTHAMREKNKEADRLVNEALDAAV